MDMRERSEEETLFQGMAYQANLRIVAEPEMDIEMLWSWINVMDICEVIERED